MTMQTYHALKRLALTKKCHNRIIGGRIILKQLVLPKTFMTTKESLFVCSLPTSPSFPLQVAPGLVNGSRHEDSAHHLTVIKM